MHREDLKRLMPIILVAVIGVIVFGGLFAFGYMRFTALSLQVKQLREDLAFTNGLFAEKTEILRKDISTTKDLTSEIARALSNSNQTVQEFQQTIGQISGTVDTLNKLSKTDPELLQKYSKVYFLNEHYVPERLTEIPVEYLYSDSAPGQIHTQVWPYLKALLGAAKAEGVPLYVKSAYRSFDEQKSIKSSYRITYGAGTANQFSADQGYSEHQLGTTADFITTGLGGNPEGFEKTSSYLWLLNNASKYGFTLSYYQGNPYYIFEPWHWRYVGLKLAAYLQSENKHFYDLEQREIDDYLINLFE